MGLVTAPLSVLGWPLTWEPWQFGLLLAFITPGFHLIASPLLEKRRVTWKDDYPAVIIGDPLLAGAGALGLWLADGQLIFLAAAPAGLLIVIGAVVFGWYQSRTELAEGRYCHRQVRSPTKLWHQYVVYPSLGYLVTVSVGSGFAAASRAPVVATLMAALTLAWALLTIEAIRNPRTGHGIARWLQQDDDGALA